MKTCNDFNLRHRSNLSVIQFSSRHSVFQNFLPKNPWIPWSFAPKSQGYFQCFSERLERRISIDWKQGKRLSSDFKSLFQICSRFHIKAQFLTKMTTAFHLSVKKFYHAKILYIIWLSFKFLISEMFSGKWSFIRNLVWNRT